MGKSRTQKTIINTVAGILNRGCNTILNFVLRTVFIITLGIQYTGVSSVFTDILTMLSLSELGISTAIATALYLPLREKNESQIRKLMTFYKNAYRMIAGFIILVGFVLLPFLDRLIRDVPDIKESIHLIFIFYIIKTAASYLLIYKTTILNADQKQYIVKGLETICTIIRYVIEIICLLIFRQFMLYLIIEVIATILQNVIVTRQAEKQYPYAFKKTDEKLNKREIQHLFKDIKGLAMYQISASVGNSIDNILVSSYISTAIVGLLSNYTMIRKQIEVLVKQFFTSVTPSIGNMVAEGNTNKQKEVFDRLFYISFGVVNFCSTSLFVLFNPFIKLWLGEDYILGNEISFIVAFDFFLYILLQAIASFRTANGLFIKGQYRPLITAVLNIFLSILLIRKYGIFGTIFATVICRLVTQWYDPYILYKYIFGESFHKFYLKYWAYILLFLSSCALTNFIANAWVVKSAFKAVAVRVVLCIIIPNVWIILWTFWTKEFHYFIDLAGTKIWRWTKQREK